MKASACRSHCLQFYVQGCYNRARSPTLVQGYWVGKKGQLESSGRDDNSDGFSTTVAMEKIKCSVDRAKAAKPRLHEREAGQRGRALYRRMSRPRGSQRATYRAQDNNNNNPGTLFLKEVFPCQAIMHVWGIWYLAWEPGSIQDPIVR